MRLNWKPDEEAVATIKRFGLTFDMMCIPSSQIDVMQSRHNHARKQALIVSNVEDYGEAMARGDVFPMIVLARVGGGKQLVIAGGNHRHEAAIRTGVTEFDAIVVECDAPSFALLCPALNLYVGQREDRSVRISQAADAVARLGISIKQAADEYRVPTQAVSRVISESKVILAAAKLGINTDKLTTAYLRPMIPIAGDAVLLPLAIELARTKISATEVIAAIKVAKELPTEADRVASLKKQIADAKTITVSGRVAHFPTRMEIRRSMTSLERIITKESSPCKLQMTIQEIQEAVQKLKKLTSILIAASQAAE